MNAKLLVGLFVTVFLIPGFCEADNWPQWRGKDLDSVSEESGLPDTLNSENQLWRFELPGPAGASPVVWGDKVFVTSTQGTESGAEMYLLCVGTDGQLKWRQRMEGTNSNSRDNANSASPSPVTDGEHVWAMMGNGILQCFTMDGDLVWKKNLQDEYGKFNIQFGMTSSPILDNGRIYLALMHGDMRKRRETSVGHVISLDAKTGNEIWYQKRLTDGVMENKHSYASPTIYRDADREFLVTHGADFVMGHSLEDGSELWRCGGMNPKDNYNPFLRFVASPSCVDGLIVVPTAKRGPILGLNPSLEGEVTNKDDTYKWRISKGTPDVASPVIYEGLVYLADEKGVLSCVDAKSGEILYQQRLFASKHRSTPVAADGKIYITGRGGNVFVVKAGSEFELMSKLELGEETTASPAVSNGLVFVRTFDGLYAFGNK